MNTEGILSRYLLVRLLIKMTILYLIVSVLIDNFIITEWSLRVRVVYVFVSLYYLLIMKTHHKLIHTILSKDSESNIE